MSRLTPVIHACNGPAGVRGARLWGEEPETPSGLIAPPPIDRDAGVFSCKLALLRRLVLLAVRSPQGIGASVRSPQALGGMLLCFT